MNDTALEVLASAEERLQDIINLVSSISTDAGTAETELEIDPTELQGLLEQGIVSLTQARDVIRKRVDAEVENSDSGDTHD